MALAGGGTGGHLFPGLALARYAAAEGMVSSVLFFGADRGIETGLVPEHGFEIFSQPITPVRGRGPADALLSLVRLTGAAWVVRGELKRRQIDVMVGLGGYASAAGTIGAVMASVPLVLLEQNRRPGMANRMLASAAAAVCTSFEESSRYFPFGRCRFTGNPVREELEEAARFNRRDTVLVFGGSAGASSINRAVVTALTRLKDRVELPPVLHQTGEQDARRVRSGYENAGIEATVVTFIDDMSAAYRRARLAICRSGATTVAELCITHPPALLVPYPYSTGDHQAENAASLADAGAAAVVSDDERLAPGLERGLERLLGDPDRLDSMARAAGQLSRPGAVARVMEVVHGILGSS